MIKRLSSEVISKIASGQIASSPSNVLKELIENALDAKAREISIKIKDPFNFKVIDNGNGIPYKELPLTVERFTTSKIESLDDLLKINSYGFRGEALHAISQVSHLTIKSRFYRESTGGKLEVKAGKVLSTCPIPFSQGTSVSVNFLYFNVPVRKKSFNSREKQNMIKVIKTFALCRPDVTFKVNDTGYFATSLEERIKQLFGKEINFKKLSSDRFNILYSSESEEERRIIGHIFVNRRPVSLPEIEKLLDELRIKNYILFIDVDPQEVDVNVTPTKDRVILKDNSIAEEIRKFLYPKTTLPAISVLRERKEINYETSIELLGTDGTVIIGHDREYYYFFDQHLIHERINYEELINRLFSKEIPLQELIPPLEIKASSEAKEKLRKFGVEFEQSGENLLVRAIPEILSIEDIKNIIDGVALESVAAVACRKAIKAGYRPLDFNDLKELFERYLKCQERGTCPHGRPIYYRIKKTRIMRKLGRS